MQLFAAQASVDGQIRDIYFPRGHQRMTYSSERKYPYTQGHKHGSDQGADRALREVPLGCRQWPSPYQAPQHRAEPFLHLAAPNSLIFIGRPQLEGEKPLQAVSPREWVKGFFIDRLRQQVSLGLTQP
jgi:hypothetical protein